LHVALFATCIGDRFFADACADTVRLLRHLGASVDFPEAQTCCGQPALNAGHVTDARRMATHTLSVFEKAEYIVLPSGSCAGMVRSHFPKLLDTPDSTRALELASRTFELSQFLVHVLGVESVGRGLEGRTVAYHHGCHAQRELGIHREPVQLLEGSGAGVLPWETGAECCGFGGLFSVKLPSVSAGMADHKLDALPEADLVTSADGACLMQLSGRAAQRGIQLPFRHLASVLWEAVS
jgi:L-lactate dehydrogenase complex protein LldE